ncbi:hypothetical protein B0H13DRAFT_555920 [Mycena leptocephala]|nr:hypothetical protein B0H13DRAFT_555920 [Mycena leptocephala]
MKSPGLLGQGLLRCSLATPKYFPADGQQPRLGQDNVNRIGRMELVKLGSRSVFRLLLLSLSLTFPLFHQSELILIARQPRHCIAAGRGSISYPRVHRKFDSPYIRATTRVGAIATSQCSKATSSLLSSRYLSSDRVHSPRLRSLLVENQRTPLARPDSRVA